MLKKGIRTTLAMSAGIILPFFVLVVHGFAQPQFPQPDIRREEIHEGDLVLSGNQVMTIEHTKFTVNGNIYLSGDSQLIIRQSIVEINHYPREEIFVSDSATLRADTTIFREFIHSGFDGRAKLFMNNSFLINLISLGGEAQAVIRNSYIFQEPFGLVQAGAQADVLIEDSIVGAIGLFFPAHVSVTIDSLRPGYFEHWSAKEIISGSLDFNIVLNRTEIKDNPGYSGGFEMGWNIFLPSEIAMSISNSVLNKLVIFFENEDVRFSNLVTRVPTDFSHKSIHLSNTTVQGQWGIFVSHGETVIEDSKGIWLWPVGGKNTIVTNTAINEFDPRNYTGTVIMSNASMTDGFEIFENSNFRMEGSVRMLAIGPVFSADSRMTRTYEVVLINGSDGTALAGVDLVLTKDGVEVWSGVTDTHGKVHFDITFDISNYLDNWILSTPDTIIRLNTAISIFSSTPVTINLERAPDGIHLWPVVYVDCRSEGSGLGTKGSPYATIQEGISSAAGGGIVRVAPGEYREDVTLKNGVILLGAGADSTTIVGNVFAWSVTGAQISGFTVKDNDTAGLHCYFSSLTITNNVIIDQPHNGIHCSNSSLTIINNVLAGNGHNGIWLIDSSNAVVKNNILVNNGYFGISRSDFSLAVIDYNDVWGNGSGGYGGNLSVGPHDISAEPIFVNASGGNFHLQRGSPCIDAGDPNPVYNDPEDPTKPGYALYPAQGTVRNDMGAYGGPGAANWSVVTAVESKPERPANLPKSYELSQNYPNPFNPITTIKYQLPKSTEVSLKIYNVLGQLVRTLVDEKQFAGYYSIRWDGKDDSGRAVASGIYLYTLRTKEFVKTRKLVIIR